MTVKQGETYIRVRYSETDKMGVVYHGNYLNWLGVGRTEYLRELGMPYSEMERNGILLVVTRVSCRYRRPAYYDDLVKVVTKIAAIQDVRIVFRYEIYRGEELLTVAETEHAFVNEQGRPVVLKKTNPFLWKRLQEAWEQVPD
jgi:acyl-CoA thioester hydrolase